MYGPLGEVNRPLNITAIACWVKDRVRYRFNENLRNCYVVSQVGFGLMECIHAQYFMVYYHITEHDFSLVQLIHEFILC